MPLAELEIADLRCIGSAELELHPGANLIVGANGSGKTSLLEAIYLLGRGRSFRTRHTDQLIRRGAQSLRVLGRLQQQSVGVIGVGFDRDDGLAVRVDRQAPPSLAALAQALPVQILDPGIHRLVEEGPAQRRKWLDWGVFHVEPGFPSAWTQHTRALRQRNAALKAQQDPTPWDGEVARYGELVAEARGRALASLEPVLTRLLTELAGPEIQITYFRGWSIEHSLESALRQHLTSDVERGSTGWGAHRFDVVLKRAGKLARESLSRGEQKVLGAAMALAITELARRDGGMSPLLLLDDPAAELDQAHTEALIRAIRAIQGQMVFTSVSDSAGEHQVLEPDRSFHVEQGRVQRL